MQGISFHLSVQMHIAVVGGPLFETHSLLTCRQPRGSQALSTEQFYPPTTARPKVSLNTYILEEKYFLAVGESLMVIYCIVLSARADLRIDKNFVEIM